MCTSPEHPPPLRVVLGFCRQRLLLSLLFQFGNLHDESGFLCNPGVYVDSPAVQFHELPDQRQAESGPDRDARLLLLEECLEYVFAVCRVDRRSVVRYGQPEKSRFRNILFQSDRDVAGGEFGCVAYEVRAYFHQYFRVGAGDHGVLGKVQNHVEPIVPEYLPESGQGVFQQGPDVSDRQV